ncbi:MAG: hypothetical protein ICV73_28895 [Acetobacteraceae bacterium]|nr:hypothetical protein [Acetobacteraceae bacterium]
MADFVIVIAAAVGLAGPAAPGATAAPATTAPSAAIASAPLSAPTVGFRTYADAASCEQAAGALTAPPGRRLVCVPVEPMVGEMANAY